MQGWDGSVLSRDMVMDSLTQGGDIYSDVSPVRVGPASSSV